MPETPETITSADIAAAMVRVADALEASRSPQAEYAGAAKFGVNVRPKPSDVVSFYGTLAQVGPAALLVPADETRVRVTIVCKSGGGVPYVSSRPGATAGAYDTAELPTGVPIVLDTRAAVYACATGSAVTVSVLVEQADYTAG